MRGPQVSRLYIQCAPDEDIAKSKDALKGKTEMDALIAYLRRNLEDTEAEVHRRIAELPDGVVRFNTWIDSISAGLRKLMFDSF